MDERVMTWNRIVEVVRDTYIVTGQVSDTLVKRIALTYGVELTDDQAKDILMEAIG